MLGITLTVVATALKLGFLLWAWPMRFRADNAVQVVNTVIEGIVALIFVDALREARHNVEADLAAAISARGPACLYAAFTAMAVDTLVILRWLVKICLPLSALAVRVCSQRLEGGGRRQPE